MAVYWCLLRIILHNLILRWVNIYSIFWLEYRLIPPCSQIFRHFPSCTQFCNFFHRAFKTVSLVVTLTVSVSYLLNLNLLNYQKTESLFILAIDTKSFFWIFNYWKIVSIKKLLKYYLLKEQKIFFSFFFFFPERLFIWTISELEYHLTTPRTKARF